MNYLRRVASFAVIGLVFANLVAMSPVQASHGPGVPPPKRIAFFNTPISNQMVDASTPSAITTAILNLITAAEPGANLRIAMYYMQRPSIDAPTEVTLIGDALIAAKKRGVNIFVVSKPRNRNVNYFEILKDHGIDVQYCRKACFNRENVNATPIMHNKFMTVSDTFWTSGTENVVLQMTSNWSAFELSSGKYNSAVQIWGDKGLYDGYQLHFGKMRNCAMLGDNSCAAAGSATYPSPGHYSVSSPGQPRLEVFPKQSGSPALTRLQQTVCPATSLAQVHIAMGKWSRAESPRRIADELVRLKNSGCDVRIVVQENSPILSYMNNTSLLPSHGVSSVHCSGAKIREEEDDETSQPGTLPLPIVHSKYMLIRGGEANRPEYVSVYTGSHNFTDNGHKRNDEMWLGLRASVLGIDDQSREIVTVFGQYEAQFESMWAATVDCRLTMLPSLSEDPNDPSEPPPPACDDGICETVVPVGSCNVQLGAVALTESTDERDGEPYARIDSGTSLSHTCAEYPDTTLQVEIKHRPATRGSGTLWSVDVAECTAVPCQLEAQVYTMGRLAVYGVGTEYSVDYTATIGATTVYCAHVTGLWGLSRSYAQWMDCTPA